MRVKLCNCEIGCDWGGKGVNKVWGSGSRESVIYSC